MKIAGFLFGVILLFSVNGLHSQSTVSGSIAGSSGLPVPFAAVTLKRLTDTNERTTTADSTGNFFFHNVITGEYSIAVSSIGYDCIDLISL